MPDADAWIDALRAAHDEIADIARPLDEAGLARTSGSSEWDVAQVLGHLGSQSEIGLGTVQAVLEHRDPPGADATTPIWAKWDALDNAGKAAGFLDYGDRYVAAVEGIDPTQRDELRIDLGFLPAPVDLATLLSLRLNELTMHGWDVKVATDPDASLLADGTELLVDRVGMLIGFIGHADEVDDHVTLRVVTSDPERSFALIITDSVSLGDDPDDPDGVLHLPAESWLRLVAGRLDIDHTPPSVKIESPTVTLDDLRRVFPGM
jgi:uncharacterized protein (TIGR03083 family)